ncbi:NhaC family Na+:H+ antiporter [Desulfitispora alkaliphila]|uniref:Na+/H+ antiporter NhaC n=1 Tax=Desulfitispora alkaliphila TaxID=622674 RepID=UPI003D25A86D
MKKKREMSLFLACLPILVVIFMALMSVTTWKAAMHTPLMASVITAVLIGLYMGYSWNELEDGLVAGVARALPAIFILMIVGTIIGSWIISGAIPALIYYGLNIINPSIFVPAAALVTGIVSISTGTSFTSIGTIGLALMVMGEGLGFPAHLTAGAVISGAYFGDKLSPLSDTTNLAPAVSGCTLFEHIGHMLYDTIPAFIVASVLYYFIGLQYVSSAATEMASVIAINEGLTESFFIHPILLVLPVITIALAIKKVPAIPALTIVSILGGLFAVVFQQADIGQILRAMTFGFTAETGVAQADNLLSRGGITSMGGTIILLSIATALGGVLEKTGALETILNAIMKKVKNTGHLLLSTLLSGLAIAFATGAQLLAIVLPARMFVPAYKERGLHVKNLSRAAEAAGTVGINLVPWSVPAVFAYNVLGVNPIHFIPYIFFAHFVILFNAIYGYTGISIAKESTSIPPSSGKGASV